MINLKQLTVWLFFILFVAANSSCFSRFETNASSGKKSEKEQGEEQDPNLGVDVVDGTGAADSEENADVTDATGDNTSDGTATDDSNDTIEDTSPPTSVVIANQPALLSDSLAYSFSLSGSSLATYSFEIVDGLTSCPTSPPLTSTLISANLAGSLSTEGSYRLCVWGRSPVGIAQLAPTEYLWTADNTAPVSTVATGGAKILANAVGGELLVTGGATDLTLTALDISIKQDASNTNCLNNGKTAFDAVCPNFISVTTDTAWSFPVPISAMSDGSSYEVNFKATDATTRIGSAVNTFTWSAVVTVYAGIQTSGGATSYLQKFSFNPSTNALTAVGTVNLATYITPQLLRGVATLPDGRIIVGDGGTGKSALVALDETVSAGPVFTGATPELGNYHGLCVLPDGSYVVGKYGNGSDVNQYAANGTFMELVYTTNVNSLTACHAFSNTNIVLVDYDANNDNNGDLVQVQYNGTSWAETARWDQSASGLPVSSSIYAMAVLNNGDIFALPQNGGGTRNKKMIKCPAGVLANCVAVGSDVIGTAEGFTQGLAVIPGTNDLLIGTGTRILRFNTGDYSSVDLGFNVSGLPNFSQLRHLVIH